jgi:hypothetical protein
MLNVGFWIFDNHDFFGDYVLSVAVGYPFCVFLKPAFDVFICDKTLIVNQN